MLQLSLRRASVGGGHIAGQRVGGLAQRRRQGRTDMLERDVKTILLRQQLGACYCRPR